ncbi:hypothetical protein Hanom_Chr12g01148741 [Helianthus anomalus]
MSNITNKWTCFRFHVVFKVIRSDQHVISDEEKVNMSSGSNTGSNTPFCLNSNRLYITCGGHNVHWMGQMRRSPNNFRVFDKAW